MGREPEGLKAGFIATRKDRLIAGLFPSVACDDRFDIVCWNVPRASSALVPFGNGCLIQCQLSGDLVLHFLLLMSLGVAAPASVENPLPPWKVACTTARDKCWMEMFVPFAGGDKQERGGVAVAYDAVAKKPMFITVFVPPSIGTKHEVIIGLLKTVPDKDFWKLEPSKTGLMSLPVMECDLQFCMARVYPQIDNDDGTSTDLFAQMQSNDFIWVLFELGGKPIRFMIPILGFRSALARAQGVPQDSTNQPVPSTPSGTR